MHERSLVRSLVRQVCQVTAANGGGVVRKVYIQIGPLAGVEAALFATAWYDVRDDFASRDVSFANAALVVEQVALVARCRECKATFQPEQFRFRCAACGSDQTDTVSGDGIVLDRIELADVNDEVSP
jgi:hydrogenase nickel incorporation protein HypA/HybF